MPAEPIRELWRRPVDNVQSLAISPDGSRCAVVTWRGVVSCWAGGRLSWKRTIPGAEEVVLGTGGRAVVYTPLDLLRRDLVVLDPQGSTARRITVAGPISAVALSPDGLTVAAGSAGGALEIHALDGPASPARTLVRGSIQQLSFDATGGLLATTAQPAWIVALTADGKVRWRHPAPAGTEFRIGAPARGAGAESLTVVAVTAAVEPDPGRASDVDPGDNAAPESDPDRIEIVAFSPTGKPVWRRRLQGRDPHLGLMAASGQVVIGYERADRRGLVLRYDRALACLARDGSPQWQRGDLLYEPLLVSASPRGDAILSLGAGNRFWLLSSRGESLWSYTAAAPIRMACASADGTAVAIVTSDGHLAMLKVSPGGRG
jgi:hypothetical protein